MNHKLSTFKTIIDIISARLSLVDRLKPLFQEYGLNLNYYKATYLVDIEIENGKRILKLEEISMNGNAWKGADVISFNTGHWWSHTGSLQGFDIELETLIDMIWSDLDVMNGVDCVCFRWDYMESGGSYYQDMDRLAAMEKGLRTWADWVDKNIDVTTTRVFFQAISPTHYK